MRKRDRESPLEDAVNFDREIGGSEQQCDFSLAAARRLLCLMVKLVLSLLSPRLNEHPMARLGAAYHLPSGSSFLPI